MEFGLFGVKTVCKDLLCYFIRVVSLGDYLKEKHEGLTKRVLKRALERGACTVNGKIERFATRPVNPSKDKIIYKDVRFEALDKLIIQPQRIIFEDEYILIYDKEGGYPALATKNEDRANLHDELRKFISNREGKKVFLDPVHRLDKDTSGLMIFAKSSNALAKMFEMFRDRKVIKHYEAIVDGLMQKRNAVIDHEMTLLKKGKGWQRWGIAKRSSKQNKTAVTEYTLIKSYEDKLISHVKLTPKTGRMHQIRVHLQAIGYPVIGDTFYADKFKSDLITRRHLLHASNLSFVHPLTQEAIKIFAPLPDDMQKLLD